MLSAFVLLLLFVLGLILQNPVRLLITGKRAEGIVVGMAGEGALKTPMVEFSTSLKMRLACHTLFVDRWPSHCLV